MEMMERILNAIGMNKKIPKRLKKILNEIKDKKLKFFDEVITEEELLFKDEEGITFLEHLLKSGIKSNISSLFSNNIEIAYIYYKCGEDFPYHNLSEDDLFRKFEDKSFIELLLEKKEPNYVIVKKIKKHPEIIEIYKKNGLISMLSSADPNILMKEYENNVTLFDYLFENGFMAKRIFMECDNIEFLKFLRNRGLYEYLAGFKEELLLTKFDGDKTLLEEIVLEGHEIKSCIGQEESIRILYKTNSLSLVTNIDHNLLSSSFKVMLNDEGLDEQTLLEYMINERYTQIFENTFLDEKDLLTEVEPGIIVLDKILDNAIHDVKVNFNVVNPLIIQKLIEHNGLGLLFKNCTLESLLEKENTGQTLLEYLLDVAKRQTLTFYSNEINLKKINPNLIVEFYLILAKNDMINDYERILREKTLKEALLEKYDGKALLELLLDANLDLTINKILYPKIKSEFEIASILISRGIEQTYIRIPIKKEKYTNEYFESIIQPLGIGPLSEAGEKLLHQLEELFINDGKSDHELVLLLVAGYRKALFENYDLNIQELKNLINIKENNYDNFCYIKASDAYFNGNVCCDRPSVNTVLHETGHALHFYLDGSRMPERYEVVRERARNAVEFTKLENLRDKLDDIESKVFAEAVKKNEQFFAFYYSENKIEERAKELKLLIEEIEKKLTDLRIPKKVIKRIMEDTFYINDYIWMQKTIYLKEISYDIIRDEYGNYVCFSDILDAIYSGELFDGKIKDKDGRKILTRGHGSDYFSSPENCFKEMVTDFGVIIKSSNATESLEYLKTLMGDELYDMLSNYYYENISKLKESEFGSIRGGKR